MHTEIVQYLAEAKDAQERIDVAVGPYYCTAVLVEGIKIIAQKLDAREQVLLGLSIPNDPYILGYLLEQRNAPGIPVVMERGLHMIPDVSVVDVIQDGPEVRVSFAFLQDTHPNTLYHEEEQEKRLQEMQDRSMVPPWARETMRSEKRGS
jgi:hypothetical protein